MTSLSLSGLRAGHCIIHLNILYVYTISYSTGSWHSMVSCELMMSVRQNSEMGEPYHLEHLYVYTLYYQCI